MRASQFLLDQHVRFETLMHPPAFTAQKRARFLHIPGRQVIKCVLLKRGCRYVLAVLRSTDHIDLEALGKHLGTAVALANDDEVADQFRDCERGALAPFGSLYDLPTVLEQSISPEDMVLFECEQHAMAIRMKCADFEMLERPTRCPFACAKP